MRGRLWNWAKRFGGWVLAVLSAIVIAARFAAEVVGSTTFFDDLALLLRRITPVTNFLSRQPELLFYGFFLALFAVGVAIIVSNRRRLQSSPPAMAAPQGTGGPSEADLRVIKIAAGEADRTVAFLREVIDLCEGDARAFALTSVGLSSLAPKIAKEGYAAVLEGARSLAVECDRIAEAFRRLNGRSDSDILALKMDVAIKTLSLMHGRITEIAGRMAQAGDVAPQTVAMATEAIGEQLHPLRARLFDFLDETRASALELRKQVLS